MNHLLRNICLSCLILSLFSTMVLADEHLKNPDFKQGLANWSVYLHSSMRSSVKRHVDNGVLTLQVDSAASSPTHVQLMQKVTTLKNNQQYILSFEARRDGKAAKTSIVCSQQGPPFKGYGLNQTITFSDAWSYHELAFTVKGVVDKNSPCIRFYLGNQVGTVELRHFSLIEKPKDQAPTDHGPVITTILGAGLNKEHFKPSNETIQKVAGEFADAGFTMTWAASPVTWVKHSLHQNEAFFAHYQKIATAMQRHNIGIAFGFHWHNVLPGKPKDYPEMYGEKLDPETGKFTKSNWNFGSEKALQEFAQNTKTLFEKTGQFEMFYADEITLASAGPKSHMHRISTYWTSPTYSVEALESFRQFLAKKNYPDAQQARFPVTTIAVEPGKKTNKGLPAILINQTNSDRLVEDNNWSKSPLWQYWYQWRSDLYSRWLDTVTTLAYEANKTNPNWMGSYYEMPNHWMVSELGQDIQQIANLPHVDYIIAGYTSGQRYASVKKLAEAAGKKWGLQVEVSRYGKAQGMSVKYIEDTFKNAVNDGASLITCYAGMSFRTDMQNPSKGYLKNGWYYMPDQANTWKACIQWLKKGRGLKQPNFPQSSASDKN